jgi:hypothetical protein
MRLPAFSTSFVAVCLALVTAFGMAAVRTGAPRERERAVRMTRGTGQRLDSGEAILHSHEDTSVLSDFSGEPKSAVSAQPDTDSNVLAAMPGPRVVLASPVTVLSTVPLPPTTRLKPSPIPPAPGRAPPSI